jgi:hypothetical protein
VRVVLKFLLRVIDWILSIFYSADEIRDLEKSAKRRRDSLKTHYLKTVNPYFQDIWDRKKFFEMREEDDRVYSVGDEAELMEYLPESNAYTGRIVHVKIPYVLRDKPFVPDGYVCFSIQEVRRHE